MQKLMVLTRLLAAGKLFVQAASIHNSYVELR
jgi:hypothetical protein